VYQKNGGTAWGHSLKELFEGLKKRIDIPQSLEKDAGTLDKYYVPARYPNGFGAGAPFEYFTNEDSSHAIGSAGRIIQFCKGILAR